MGGDEAAMKGLWCGAGDRVVADPLCKPFSMGRNLFCVHSRKRMDDIPELKAEKQVRCTKFPVTSMLT